MAVHAPKCLQGHDGDAIGLIKFCSTDVFPFLRQWSIALDSKRSIVRHGSDA